MLASSTGNIYGIYDISGGSWEWTATWETKSTNLSNGSSFAKSGESSTPYATAYSNGSMNNYPTTATCILGDATYEVNVDPESVYKAWFDDCSLGAETNASFFVRGGVYYNGTEAGVFYTNASFGVRYRINIPRGIAWYVEL